MSRIIADFKGWNLNLLDVALPNFFAAKRAYASTLSGLSQKVFGHSFYSRVVLLAS
jgi:hypothetical protein